MKIPCTDGLITLVMVKLDENTGKLYMFKIPPSGETSIAPGTRVGVQTSKGVRLGTVVSHPLTCKSGGLVLDFIVTALGITGQIKPVLYVIKQIPLVYDESQGVVRRVREKVIEDITAGSGYGYEDGMDD